MARQVFEMIDKDDSGELDKAEIVTAVQSDKDVIKFLVNCGNENLQHARCVALLRTGRGDAAAATRVFRGDESRRRREMRIRSRDGRAPPGTCWSPRVSSRP